MIWILVGGFAVITAIASVAVRNGPYEKREGGGDGGGWAGGDGGGSDGGDCGGDGGGGGCD